MAVMGRQAERRKRWAMYLVAAAALLAVGIVIETYRKRTAAGPKVAPKVSILPKGVHQELSEFTYTRSEGGRRVFTIHARRTLSLEKGRKAVLQDVRVEFFGRSGNGRDLLRTRQAEYDAASGDFTSSARVELELNTPARSLSLPTAHAGAQQLNSAFLGKGPIKLETSKIAYDDRGSLLVTQAPVRFTAGALSGTAVGMTYDTRAGWLELQHQVQIALRRGTGLRVAAPIHLTASRFRYDHRTGEGKFGGPVTISEAGLTAVAAGAEVWLDSRNRVTQAWLNGGVWINQSSPNARTEFRAHRLRGWLDPTTEQLRFLRADGQVQASSIQNGGASTRVAADRARIDFSQGKPVEGKVAGQVKVVLTALPGSPAASASRAAREYRSEELTTGDLKFRLWPQGEAFRQATTNGPGELILLPRPGATGSQRIYAGQLKLGFDARNHLESLDGSQGTRLVVFTSARSQGGALKSVSTSERLAAFFNPATEALQSAEQVGDFRFERGEQQAAASRAAYNAADETLHLTGHPRAWDPGVLLEANQIWLNRKTNAMEGLGHVRARYTEPAHGSALPSHILADRADAVQGGNTLRFEGNVRAWHGDDVIEAPTVEILRPNRWASAGPSVVSSYLVAGTLGGLDPRSGQRAQQPELVTIQAEHLDYSDQAREASYVGHVVMKTQQSTLRTDRMNVYFSPAKAGGGLEIARATADGHVRVTQPGRWAKGERAVYNAATGEIQMTGGPPTLYDAKRGITTGRRLTFWLQNDTVRVDEGRNFTRPPRPAAAP